MNIDSKHPSAMSDQERADLIASDPAAFDQDASASSEAAKPEAAAAEPAKAAAPEQGEATTKEGDAAAETEAAKTETPKETEDEKVDKRAFNGLLAELRATREELKELKANNQPAAPAAARDFEADKKALKEKYDNNELDDDEYMSQREALVIEQAEARALARAAQFTQEQASKSAQESWNSRITAWEDKHAAFLADPDNKQAASGLLEAFGKDTSLTDDKLIEKVEKALGLNATKTPPPPQEKPNPHAARNAADAAAAAAASAAPPALSAGTGNRGGPSSSIDLSAIKQGEFSKLPKSEQEKLLGDGALD